MTVSDVDPPYRTNANAVRMATWAFMELIRDDDLYQAVRKEVMENCLEVDPITGARSLDAQKMLKLPLLQSMYVETLRLHVSVNVTREVVQPQSLHHYNVEEGAMLQAPSQLAHYDEEVWGESEHPASKFWAERHLQYVEKTDESGSTTRQAEFNMAGRVGSYFPYGRQNPAFVKDGCDLIFVTAGGGISICPGRHFAKQEIIFTLGTLVARFDVEFVDWIQKDGSKADRPAQNDKRFAGAVGMPPDRDMQYRWKRLW